MAKKVNNRQYAKALYEITKGLSPEKMKKAVRGFVEYLAKKNRLKQGERIVAEFLSFAKSQEGIQEIEITCAHELETKTLEKIKKVFGEKVEATIKLDPAVLGGIKVKTADKIFDASLQKQLSQLRISMS